MPSTHLTHLTHQLNAVQQCQRIITQLLLVTDNRPEVAAGRFAQ
jgi:hypothetical protein